MSLSLIFLIWASFGVLAYILRRNPNSKLGQALFTWYGPVPKPKENAGKYYLKWAGLSLGIGIFMAVIASVIVVLNPHNELTDTPSMILMGLFFAHFMFAAAGLFAGIGFLFKAAIYRKKMVDEVDRYFKDKQPGNGK